MQSGVEFANLKFRTDGTTGSRADRMAKSLHDFSVLVNQHDLAYTFPLHDRMKRTRMEKGLNKSRMKRKMSAGKSGLKPCCSVDVLPGQI